MFPMRRLALASAAIAVAVVLAAVPLRGDDSDEKLQALQRWLAAVDEHRPGARDAAAERIGAWTNQELDALVPVLETFIDLVREPRRTALPKRKGIDAILIDRIREIARAEQTRGDVNRVVKRGAMLHADIMMSGAAPTRERIGARQALRVVRTGGRVSIYGMDGQHEGFAVAPPHWSLARRLLDAVSPDAAADSFVRAWYRATTAYLLNFNYWGELEHHLRHARERLTPDANIHMDSGCLYEAVASPRAQSMIASIRGSGVRPDVRSLNHNLELADMHFQQATVLEPLLIEARVRLAHVRIALGRAAEAAPVLEADSIAATDPVVRYYAVLFLGQAHDALGNADAAFAAYQRAAALYPTAQAPHLAISMLAREGGDREAAQAALWNFLRAPVPDRNRLDPWWEYFQGSGRKMRQLLMMLWNAAPGAGTPKS